MTGGQDWQGIAEMLLLGSATGFMAGLLGIGGGMVLVPFMTLLLTHKGVAPELVVKMAIATSLATICFTSMSSVRAHHQRGAVLWPVVGRMTPGILLGSLLGAQLATALPATALELAFAGFVSFSALQMLRDAKPTPSRQLPGPAGMVAAGGLVGLLAALVGAGGAFVCVPFLTWCNVKIHNAVASSAALGFPVALAGTAGYVMAGHSLKGLPPGAMGYLYLPALFTVATASVLTAPLGAGMAHRLRREPLKRIFVILLFSLSAYMLLRAVTH
jgi:uncharacterized membrane protein YfcA